MRFARDAKISYITQERAEEGRPRAFPGNDGTMTDKERKSDG